MNTDEEGEYSMSGLIPGDYYLRIRPVVAGGLPRLPGHGYDEVYAGCLLPRGADSRPGGASSPDRWTAGPS